MANNLFSPPKDELSSRDTQLCIPCNCDMWGLSIFRSFTILEGLILKIIRTHINIALKFVQMETCTPILYQTWPKNYTHPKCALWWYRLIASSVRIDVWGHAIHFGVAIPALNLGDPRGLRLMKPDFSESCILNPSRREPFIGNKLLIDL